jgi:hypothetical protein
MKNQNSQNIVMKKATILWERSISAWQKINPAWRFSVIAVTGMRVAYTLWSFVFLAMFPTVVQNQEFFGEPVVAVFDMQTSRSSVYNRFVDGDLLTFRKYSGVYISDNETGSIWRISDGRSVSGYFEGRGLHDAKITTEGLFPYHGVSTHRFPLIAIWQRFDVNWYLSIAQNGYGSVSGDVHFPPFYPILIQLLSFFLRDDMLSALLIAQAALYYLVKLLYELFSEQGGDEIAKRSIFLLLIFPTSFFFFSAYTEAIFIIFAILCLKAVQNHGWHWAGFWIFCAILVRLQGMVLLLPLAWGLLQTRLKPVRFIELFFAGLGPAIAIGLYLLVRAKGGDESVIPFVEENLHARIAPPWDNIIYAFQFIRNGLAGYIDYINLAALALFSILIAVNWRKFRVEHLLFMVGSILLFTMRLVDTQPLNSMTRYLLTIFPVFFLIGKYTGNTWMNRLVFLIFLILNLFLSAQFFLWGWVA